MGSLASRITQLVMRRLHTLPPVANLARGIYFWTLARRFDGSAAYWEARYRRGGNSGAGSYGALALYKAEVLNRFVQESGVETVIELGCGDGAQLELAHYHRYHGIDVSSHAIEQCRERFHDDPSKTFALAGSPPDIQSDLALSLDVIYHLVEDTIFEAYMQGLFRAACRYAIIYSSNIELAVPEPHVRHRRFTDWIQTHRPEWHLRQTIKNRYPFDPRDPANTSFADFYIFEKQPVGEC